jgi:hypothetical protein
MTAGVICFTSFTWSYVARARVLAASVRAANPDWRLWAVLVDRPPAGAPARRLLAAFDRVLTVADLGIARWRAWLFKHELVEACCAVKGAALRAVLAHGPEWAVYLDPDIAAFHPITALRDAGREHAILLTPHQARPSPTARARADNEATSLRYGAYNLGFLAVRNDPQGHAFAAWWDARLQEACYDEPGAGLFVDQKYCDLVPAMFSGVLILRDPGCNVASWNLAAREVGLTRRGELRVDGCPLQFFHFSKAGGIGDAMIERHAAPASPAREVWTWYRRPPAPEAAANPGGGRWFYADYEDGVPISRAARILYRRRDDLIAAFDNPYDPAGLRTWLAREAPETLAPGEA